MRSSSSTLFFLLLLLMIFLSRETEQSQLILPLTHSLSTTHRHHLTSPIHLIKSTLARSISRHRNHRNHNHNKRNHLSLPLSPGSDYTLTFTLHSQQLSLYMDTGSDIVWTPCSPFECILCEGKTPSLTTPLNLTTTSLLPCQSPSCSAAHSSTPTSDLCAIAHCPLDQIETGDCNQKNYPCPPFYYAYGDGSLVAKLHTETLHMAGVNSVIPNFTFGCAHTTFGEPIGVAGFGRGALSFPNQLARVSPELGNQFSYCLVSHSFDGNRIRRPSPLILGQNKRTKQQQQHRSSRRGKTVFTPMLDNPKHPYFYSVGLEAVSIGSIRIPSPANLVRVDRRGNGGVVVDSGTTYTMLPSLFYATIAGEFDRQIGKVYKRATETESRTGLRHCYYVVGEIDGGVVPELALHFAGNSTVVLPKRNWFYQFKDGEGKLKKRMVGCLMVLDAGVEDDEDVDSGPGATLGNYQQQGFEVVYDLENRRIGFGRRKCDDMWQELA